ncbi:MAG: hypothetical protein K0Q50_682 [Vampirovibrio sp.]|jgi:hypothetical protein|nr:hypothetical protein [Vampirovibrio sp.]
MTTTVSGPSGMLSSKERLATAQGKPVRSPGTPSNVSAIFLGSEDAAKIARQSPIDHHNRIIKVNQAKSDKPARLANYPKFG